MADVKRTVKGQKTMATNVATLKVRVHPHTKKALSAVSINSGIKHHSQGSTNNGLKGSDSRY